MTEETVPIILNLGKKRKRALKELKRGRGRLMDEVEQAVEEVRAGLGAEASLKQIVPIVLIYRKKQKRRGKGWGRLF